MVFDGDLVVEFHRPGLGKLPTTSTTTRLCHAKKLTSPPQIGDGEVTDLVNSGDVIKIM